MRYSLLAHYIIGWGQVKWLISGDHSTVTREDSSPEVRKWLRTPELRLERERKWITCSDRCCDKDLRRGARSFWWCASSELRGRSWTDGDVRRRYRAVGDIEIYLGAPANESGADNCDLNWAARNGSLGDRGYCRGRWTKDPFVDRHRRSARIRTGYLHAVRCGIASIGSKHVWVIVK